jgi:hypothetical protein
MCAVAKADIGESFVGVVSVVENRNSKVKLNQAHSLNNFTQYLIFNLDEGSYTVTATGKDHSFGKGSSHAQCSSKGLSQVHNCSR